MAPTLEALLDAQSPAWPEVQGWIADSPRTVEVLPRDPARAERTLLALDVSTRFTLGALAWETGGLLVDEGWLRILGSGSERMPGSLLTWNGLGGEPKVAATGGSLIVAHDAVGGVFALDGGGLGTGDGGAFYFAPDSLEWEELGQGYTQLLHFFFTGDLGGFYESLRWRGWQKDMAALQPDQAFSLQPPPWTAEGKDVGKVSRRAVPAVEQFRMELELGAKLQSGGDAKA